MSGLQSIFARPRKKDGATANAGMEGQRLFGDDFATFITPEVHSDVGYDGFARQTPHFNNDGFVRQLPHRNLRVHQVHSGLATDNATIASSVGTSHSERGGEAPRPAEFQQETDAEFYYDLREPEGSRSLSHVKGKAITRVAASGKGC